MNKIKQNKITFTLILLAIAIIFSSLTILSLPVLFNYKSKVELIEKNFYKNFKIYLNSSDKISFKPFPKPHLLVENATLNLYSNEDEDNFLEKSNLKIFISLRDIYLRSFKNFLSTEISNSNLEFKISDIKALRNHLYKKINKQIIFNNCKIFIKNKKGDIIIISPIKKLSYKINKKNKIKSFIINGQIFGLKYKSEWKRSYTDPKKSSHEINIFNPNIEIQNILELKSSKQFNGVSKITYFQDKIEYKFSYNNHEAEILSPNKKDTNFNIDGKIKFKPFYFVGELNIKNKKIEKIIDNFLLNLLVYEKKHLGNFSGEIGVKFDNLNNKLIKSGKIDLVINEKQISLKEANFKLDKIGDIKSKISFIEDNGNIKFISKNELDIKNYIEFAKIFQVSSKKIKNIKKIYFDLQKNIGMSDVVITNVKINNLEGTKISEELFFVKNIQNLRSHIRKIID